MIDIRSRQWINMVRSVARHAFEENLERVVYLSELNEQKLRQERKDHEQWLADEVSKYPEDQRAEVFEAYSDTFAELEDELPVLARTSMIVIAYGLLEVYLSDVCGHLRDTLQLSLSPADIRGQGIERSRVYLKKVVLVSFPDTGEDWQHIRTIQKVRNVMVHDRSDVANDQKLRRLVTAHECLSVDTSHRIVPSDKAAQWLADLLLRFTSSLYDEISRFLAVR